MSTNPGWKDSINVADKGSTAKHLVDVFANAPAGSASSKLAGA